MRVEAGQLRMWTNAWRAEDSPQDIGHAFMVLMDCGTNQYGRVWEILVMGSRRRYYEDIIEDSSEVIHEAE